MALENDSTKPSTVRSQNPLVDFWFRLFPAKLLREDLAVEQVRVAALEEEKENLHSTLLQKGAELDSEVDKNRELARVVSERDATISDLGEERNTLASSVARLSEIDEKYELVSSLLGAEPDMSQSVLDFQSILKSRFFPFANKESSLDREAFAVQILRNVEKQLIRAASFSAISTKTIGAIGGGFSSGKSAFVNSFFCDPTISLPTGIKPVTAIPSYVVAKQGQSRVSGFSDKGGEVVMNAEFYARLSHEFVHAFRFNLKSIMPFMTVATPLDDTYFEHVCLIDTPGYNPAQGGSFASEDATTAREALQDAEFLIWMVGLDATGTMPASDLEFIERLEIEDKKLFVVANKADLKSPDEVQEIIECIRDCLDDYDIACEGISAYSAVRGEEISYLGKSVFDFLEECNTPNQLIDSLKKDIGGVCQLYKSALQKEISSKKKTKELLKSLQLDILESGFEEASDSDSVQKIEDRLDQIAAPFGTSELEAQLTEIGEIEDAFLCALGEFENELPRYVQNEKCLA